MTAVALHNHAAAATAPPGLMAMDSPSSDSTGSSTEAATISANDFLTLLVTEMKNQDPTANTDPNEYINQLVNVNSLEQLISINQTLSGALDPSQPSSANREGRGAISTTPASAANKGPDVPTVPERHIAASSEANVAQGNLGVPAVNPSAQRIAESLSGASGLIGRHQRPAS